MAIILVVFHHAIQQTVEAEIAAEWWLAFTEFMRTMRMPLFFAAAGLFASKWIVRESWRSLLRSKVLLFAWVYLLWFALRTAWDLLVLREPFPGVQRLTIDLLGGNYGWFIYSLAGMFVVAKLVRRTPAWLQLIVFSVTSTVLLWHPIGPLGIRGVPTYIVFFLVGVYGREMLLRAAERTTLPLIAAAVAVWIAGYWGLAALVSTEMLGVNLVVRLFGLAAGIALAVMLQRIKLLRHFGQGTLPIYMTHQMWIGGLVPLALIWIETTQPVLILSPLVFGVIAFTVAYVLGRTAPRIRAAWLFETPQWLLRVYDRATIRATATGR